MEKEQVKQDNTSHNKSKLKVGIFCIAAVVIFYLGACFFKGVSAFGKKTYYYAVFENTGGQWIQDRASDQGVVAFR